MEELELQIEKYLDDNNAVSTFKKMFASFEIDIPTNVRKKLEAREKKNNLALDELMRKHTRMSKEKQIEIENQVK